MHLYLNRQHSFLSSAENKNRIKNPALKDNIKQHTMKGY